MQADQRPAMQGSPSTERPDLLLQKSYWLRRFRSPMEQSSLPAHSRRRNGSRQRSEYKFALPRTLGERLMASAGGSLDSIYNVSLAALSLVLSAHTRSSEILIATRARLSSETPPDGAIPLRIDVPRSGVLSGFRSQVEREVTEAYEHSEVCVASLLKTLDFTWVGVAPVYPVLAGMDELHSNCGLERYRSDLSFSFSVDAGDLGGKIEYDSTIYEAAWMRCIADQWVSALSDLINRPFAQTGEIRLQSSEALLSHLSAPSFPTSELEQSIFQRFVDIAEHAPDDNAAVHGDETITYRKLYNRAARLAESFREAGADQASPIAILLPRSFGMLAAMLASLSIGSPYVLIDPDLPVDRVKYYLSDSSPIVVITGAAYMQEFRSLIDQIGCIRTTLCSEEALGETRHGTVAVSPAYGRWAYIVYTSGSTGNPKGAIGCQRGALNHILGEIEALSLDRDLRFLQSAPSSSDIIMWQFLAPLVVGGRSVIADRTTVMDPRSLFEEMKRTEVTLAEMVPGTLFDILDYAQDLPPENRRLPHLKRLIVTGEATDVTTFNRWFSLYPDVPLINCFGPAEASDDVCQFVATRPLDSYRMRVPVGVPLPNVRIYVLDHAGQPAAVSVPGEIHIGGVAVGDGYWKNGRRTAEFFLCDPFAQQPGSRMYRTGDVGRWLPDGNLEFLGRIDNQIKVRGNRVQPDEIEAALAAEPGVRRAVVGTIGDDPTQKALVAWVTLRDISDPAELEDSASEQISQWQTVFEDTYSRRARQADPTFNIAGWNSSYTGLPIPATEMREWVDATVQRITALQPKRVLEIGCGTGLLLLRLAPQAQFYAGTDFSPKAIEYVRREAKQLGIGETLLYLSVRAADDFTGMENQYFDTIILNSIIQYFPDESYLMRVLRGAVRQLSPGGSIFVGDVRSLPLLPLHHLSVEVRRASPQTRREHFLQLVKTRVDREEELVVHPYLFTGLQSRIPGISSVSVQAKRGSSRNELTKFRYDVILSTEAPAQSAALPLPLEWNEDLKISRLSSLLPLGTTAGSALIADVPDARLHLERLLLSLLEREDAPGTVGELREELAKASGAVGWDPEEIWAEASAQGLHLKWLRERASGRFDLLISTVNEAPPITTATVAEPPPERLTNQPLNGRFFARMAPKLRELLVQKFPSYMVPSYFVRIDSVPLTNSGKIDMQALPKPEMARLEARQAYVAPHSSIQKVVTNIWSDLLAVPRIGMQDNFFELGGHSLLATQVTSRIRKVFQIDLSLRDLFEGPTVEALSRLIEVQDASLGGRSAKIAEILLQVKAKS
jgi:amino acid adenylation domain-containing protein